MLNKNGLCQIVKTNFNYFKVYIMIIFWAQDSVYVASIVVVHVFIESEGKQSDKQQIHVYNNTKLHVKLACIYKDILFVSMRNVPDMYLPRTCTSINVHRNARINETMQWYMTGIFLNIVYLYHWIQCVLLITNLTLLVKYNTHVCSCYIMYSFNVFWYKLSFSFSY